MVLEAGKVYSGFFLETVKEISDIESVGYKFKHLKSGAKLFYISNNDDNKVFFISFKTPPNDDCGAAHIVEHSVLCGSKKYGVKDPFNEMAKGSLNTYLNALTYSDKTMYPVASRNEKDFKNLIDVYLDAVFNPLMLENKNIFLQEGWHYNIDSKESDITYKGIVFNEMKGAYSSPERILNNGIYKSLFPEACYKYESGGNPDFIPELSYEEFINFYKKYYHPSNSYIYFYGDIDIKQYLQYMDNEYLNKFENKAVDSEIKNADSGKVLKTFEDSYSVLSLSDENLNYFSKNYIIGESKNGELSLSFDILNYILMGTNSSPLKKALIEKNIAEDITGWFSSSSQKSVYSIVAKKTKAEQEKAFLETINDTLLKLVKNGIDKDIINAALNVWEFHLKEEDYGFKPKGLAYGMKAMQSILYGEETFDILMKWKYFNTIRSNSNNGYFENLISKYILNNELSSFVILKPEKGKEEKKNKIIKDKLDDFKKSLSEYEINKLIEETKLLKLFQETKDNESDIKKIPMLKLSDIEKGIEFDKTFAYKDINSNIIFTPFNTSGISYIKIMFDLSNLPNDLITYAGFLASILGKIGTKKYTTEKLLSTINTYIGELNVGISVFNKKDGSCLPAFCVYAKALNNNVEKTLEICREIILNTVFENFQEIRKNIIISRLRLLKDMVGNGHLYASLRCRSYFSGGAFYKDITGGIDYYSFINGIEKEFEKNFEHVREKLKTVSSLIFNRENLFFSVSTEESKFEELKCFFDSFYASVNNSSFDISNKAYDFKANSIKKEGIIINSKVQFNSFAANTNKYNFYFAGTTQVLKTIISLDYLWNKIRLQGGAYGAGCNFLRNGDMYLYSYRDPNILYTFDCFRKIEEYLQNFNVSKREMNRYILGTINNFDRKLNNSDRAEAALSRFIAGVDIEILKKEKEEILSSEVKDIRSFSNLFRMIYNEEFICTLGNNMEINKNKGIYNNIFTIDE